MRRLTLTQVRRAHIAAQGLAEPRPTAIPDIRHLRKAMKTMAVLQIDSVNVRKPTLEDVFLVKTGHRFGTEE